MTIFSFLFDCFTGKTNKHAIFPLNVAFACRRVRGDEWLMAVGLFLLGSSAQRTTGNIGLYTVKTELKGPPPHDFKV